MKISYHWLQEYIQDPLPTAEVIKDALTFHSFEVEGMTKVREDYIFDIATLPNRNHDCLSHRGVAREVAAIFSLTLKEKSEYMDYPLSANLSVHIDDSKLCRRYCGALMKEVNVGPSPVWLADLLDSIGQRSINTVVDATNYVMFSIGQPLHAFDADKLEMKDGKYVISVDAKDNGQKITALDGKEYSLPSDALLIKDGNSREALGVAGIKGGIHAAITPETKNIIVESANFDPVLIRKTAKKIGLATDASKRFENELTPQLAFEGLTLVLQMINQLAGGEVEGFIDVYPKPQPTYKTGVSVREINSLLGTKLGAKDVEDIFNRLNFIFEKINPSKTVLEIAETLIDKPYKYGASVLYDAPREFDCSSLISYLHVQAGIAIPRMAVDQYVWGTPISKEDLRAGDVIFAATGQMEKKIDTESVEFLKGTPVPEGVDHCGLYLADNKVMHATSKMGKVVIEDLAESIMFKNIVGYRRMINSDDERFVVSVPQERLDIRIKEDLIEEVGRIYGYEHVEPRMPKILESHDLPTLNKNFYYADLIRSILTDAGFSEISTYAFGDTGEVEVENPMASDKSFLRQDLSTAMNKSLEFNLKHLELLGLDCVKLFEIGTVFKKSGEYMALCIGIAQPAAAKGDTINEQIRNTREMLVEKLGAAVSTVCTVDDTGGILLIKSKPVGIINNIDGVLELNVQKLIDSLPDISEKVLANINFNSEDSREGTLVKFKPISPYPFVLRDIAVFVPGEKGKEDEVLSLIKNNATELLASSHIFDVFTKISKTDPADIKTSYAFRLVFQSQEKTLSDDEVNIIMQRVTDILNSQPGWQVR